MHRLAVLFLILFVASGCEKKNSAPDPGDSGRSDEPVANVEEELSESQKQIRAITRSEDLLQSFADSMSLLTKSFVDTSIARDSVLPSEIDYRGLTEFDLAGAISEHDHGDLAVHVQWPLEPSGSFRRIQSSDLWAPVMQLSNFDDCQIGTLATRFEGGDFLTDTKMEGRFQLPGGQVIGFKAYQTLTWNEVTSGSWKIVKWDQTAFKMISAPQALFEDVTEQVIPNAETRAQVQNASHVDLILKNAKISGPHLKDTQYKYKHFNDWESAYQYPCVSVVDLDRDGFDDLFVTDRWQSGQLLKNQGDGTFSDVTEEVGLKVEQLANSVFFADFDNDGDSDVFVGGTLEPCRYFENVDGVFRPDDLLNDEYKDLKFVVSGSVVDINRDGLLDLYLNTYGLGTGDATEWIGDSVRVEDQVKMRMKVERSHFYLDRAGAPNIVLLNQKGKLKRVEIDDVLAQWRNSYQTVWTDFDLDGDQDLYLCNDFSPDCFLRNDTERASDEIEFTDVSQDMVPGGTMGFGMGASWGDFNNDGQLDLYVSNMYSKAGNRIVSKFADVDERVKVSARGNFLYENTGGKFKQVAGTEDGNQLVSQVGWSFGGQFADFDNDGFLDLYVPSGFYTPPPEVRKEGDW